MTDKNFNSNKSEPICSLLALCLAVAIIMAGFIFPDVQRILNILHLLPLLGAVVLLAGLNVIFANSPEPDGDLPEASNEYIPPPEIENAPDANREDQWIILGQLAGNIVHEVNNAMQPAMTYAQLLRDQGKMEGEQDDTINDLIASQQQSARILQHFYQLTHSGDLALRELLLTHTIKHALESIRPLLPATLILQFGDLSRVKGNARINENQLALLLALLMTNASYATGRSGMVAVHLRSTDGNTAELIVADNRTQTTDDTASLLSAQRIAQSWQGDIKVEFQHGKGRTTRVIIPLSHT